MVDISWVHVYSGLVDLHCKRYVGQLASSWFAHVEVSEGILTCTCAYAVSSCYQRPHLEPYHKGAQQGSLHVTVNFDSLGVKNVL